MKVYISRLPYGNRTAFSFYRFSGRIRDLGDYVIFFLCWEIKIFKADNPWKPKEKPK